MRELILEARAKVESNLPKIVEIVRSDLEKSQYKLHSIDETLLLASGNSDKAKISIGFPFPLVTQDLDLEEDLPIQIYFRGEPIRRYQRKMLEDSVDKVEEISDIGEFREICKKIFSSEKSGTYWDPYSFTGDSFIGTHFLKRISEIYDLSIEKVVSAAHHHLKPFYNSQSWLKSNPIEGAQIFSDLIDIHWINTLPKLKESIKNGLPSIVIGRNLAIGKDGSKMVMYWYNSPDYLLRDENIEDYMNGCLNPFCSSQYQISENITKKGKNIIINPFGSENIKTIPVEVISDFLENIIKDFPDKNLSIIEGFRNHISHINWVSELKGKLVNRTERNVDFVSFSDLSEMVDYIYKEDIGFGITADTSIAHIFNYLGLLNFTTYNLERCDVNNIQSLTSDSPLGFCRYSSNQLPILLDSNNVQKLGKSMYSLYRELIEGTHQDIFSDFRKNVNSNMADILSNLRHLNILYKQLVEKVGPWMLDVYNPKKLAPEIIDEEFTKLAMASWNINPFYKLGGRNDKEY